MRGRKSRYTAEDAMLNKYWRTKNVVAVTMWIAMIGATVVTAVYYSH